MLEDMQGQLQASDDKRQAAIAELSSKHQKVKMHQIPYYEAPLLEKSTISSVYLFFYSQLQFSNKYALRPLTSFILFQQIESLEAQLADTLSERNKATDSISALQV